MDGALFGGMFNTASHSVVTVIEFLSPANKSGGTSPDLYFKKQREGLKSTANLVEIDPMPLRGPLPVLTPVTRHPSKDWIGGRDASPEAAPPIGLNPPGLPQRSGWKTPP